MLASPSLQQAAVAAMRRTDNTREPFMIDVVVIQPWLALILGVLILIVPRLLNYAVALYLIVVGVIGLMQLYNITV